MIVMLISLLEKLTYIRKLSIPLYLCFQYVFVPLFFRIASFGTCFIISRRLSRSTDDAIAFRMIKNFNVGVNSPKTPNSNGKMIEIKMKGAMVMKRYLDFEISSSVMTKPPKKVRPIYVLSD